MYNKYIWWLLNWCCYHTLRTFCFSLFWMKTECLVVPWFCVNINITIRLLCVGIFWWMTKTHECYVIRIWIVYAISFNTCTCTHWDKCDKGRLVNCWIISSVMENNECVWTDVTKWGNVYGKSLYAEDALEQ